MGRGGVGAGVGWGGDYDVFFDVSLFSKLRVFTKRLTLRPIELRFFLVGGLFDRTAIPTLPGAT